MLNHSIPIGTDAQGNPVRFPADHIPHTLITGGSGTDRERILRSLAESAQATGVPVFLTDTRGSLSGLSSAVPCTLWDLRGSTGLPLRTTVTELGPLLLAKLLGLNDRQSDLLRIVFRIADENGLLLIDTKDLKALLNEITDNSAAYEKEYGTFADESVTAIRNAVVSLETKGAEDYLFEPAIDGEDLLADAESGEARVHILDARNQAGEGTLYAVFLLFMLGEFCENMPDREEGDPFRFLFMIDEAPLFFRELSDSVMGKVGQLLEGLEAKGVAVFFAAAEDQTLPEVLEYAVGQRLQVQSQTQALLFRGEDDAAEGLSVTLNPYGSRTKSLTAQERRKLAAADTLHEKYKIPFDRDSAYEFLKRRGLDEEAAAVAEAAEEESAAAENTAEENAAEGSITEAGTTQADTAEESAEANAAQTAAAEENSEASDKKSKTTEKEAAEKNADKEAMAKRAKSSAKSLGNTVAGTVGRQVGKSIGSVFGDFGETLGGNIGASLGRGIVNTLFKS